MVEENTEVTKVVEATNVIEVTKISEPTDKTQIVMNTRIKELLNGMGLLVSGDYYEAFNEFVIESVRRSGMRAKANNRKTVRAFDTI